MLFQDLPIKSPFSNTDIYHQSIWSRWHAQALLHCNRLVNRLMIADFEKSAAAEISSATTDSDSDVTFATFATTTIHNTAPTPTTSPMVGLSPSIDLLLLGLPTAMIDTVEYNSVGAVLLVNASVVEGHSSNQNKGRIDLVETLFSEGVIDARGPDVLEHVALRNVAKANRAYTNWYKDWERLTKYQQQDSQHAIAMMHNNNTDARIAMENVLESCGDSTSRLSPELIQAMIPSMSLDLVSGGESKSVLRGHGLVLRLTTQLSFVLFFFWSFGFAGTNAH